MPIATLPIIDASLAERGWATHMTVNDDAQAIVGELNWIGDMLGTQIPGRTGVLDEVLKPQAFDEAHPRSLSGKFGLNALPFHVDLSHRLHPCRYILLGCLNPGCPSAETMLLDWRTIGFSSEELDLLKAAPLLVRNGRRSFYSTILSRNCTFLRYDPGCMEAIDERGRTALDIIQNRLAASQPEFYKWHRGDIMIIDNWRMLHGRTSTVSGSGRRIARILIDA